jgi:hypothetical protein
VVIRLESVGFLWGDRAMAIFDGMAGLFPLPGVAVGLGLMLGELFGWLVD